MNAHIAAIPGQWYRDASSGVMFHIVGIDEDDRSIDIQHVDGSRDKTYFDDWMARSVQSCEPPEHWKIEGRVLPFDDAHY